MKKGFTMAELMIVLVVLGVITAILTPTLMNSVGDTNRQLYKSAVNIVQESVSELLANNTLYPDGVLTNGATSGSTATSTYFCQNFTNLVNTIKVNNSCNNTLPTVNSATFSFASTPPEVITSNGMYWWGLKSDFSALSGNNSACGTPPDITVGAITYKPTIVYVGLQGKSGKLKLYDDVFRIFVYGNGKVTVPDDTSCAQANTSANEMIYLSTTH